MTSNTKQPIYRNYLKHLNNSSEILSNGTYLGRHIVYKQNVKSNVNYGNTTNSVGSKYLFPTYTANSNLSIGVISLGGTYSDNDIKLYWTTVLGRTGSSYPGVTFINVSPSSNNSKPNGKLSTSDGSSIENTLDIELSMGMSGSHINFYSASNTNSGFLTAINRAVSDGNKIITISWGGSETAFTASVCKTFEQSLSTAYLNGVINTALFTDVVTGGDDTLAKSTGLYISRSGYDQCTGLGTPKGVALANVLH